MFPRYYFTSWYFPSWYFGPSSLVFLGERTFFLDLGADTRTFTIRLRGAA